LSELGMDLPATTDAGDGSGIEADLPLPPVAMKIPNTRTSKKRLVTSGE